MRNQLAFPSMGFWVCNIRDPELENAVARAWNDWAMEDIMGKQDRIFAPAIIPLMDVGNAVAEAERAAEMGFKALYFPCGIPDDRAWGLDIWEPLWTAAERMGLPLTFHIGTGSANVVYRGPGGAVVNYMETTYPGMRVVSHMVAGGALDRHPDLKVLIAEGGAAWVPAIGDRMDEAYRQHGMFVRPRLSRLPSEIIRQQVFASFQHDISAVQVIEDTHYDNVLWGDDYPHLEGTYGHPADAAHHLRRRRRPHPRPGAARRVRGAFRGMSSTDTATFTAPDGLFRVGDDGVHLIASRSSRSEFLVFPAEPGQETVELEHLGHVVHLDQPGVRTARTGYHRR